ncbi:MAG TPA: hypothetical protein VN461_09585 [Vicinamibacteria bacterium]|jgi:hypothetical protein|nr:hypothetical protein [Vicinamibacteria bacterium]
MIDALREGFRAVRRNSGLAVLLLVINLGLAAVLAVPLAGVLERDLHQTDAGANMMYGFDYAWWSHWWDEQKGWTGSFGPEIFGAGFAFRNLELLLQGDLPARLFSARREENGDEPDPANPRAVDPVILGLGVVYLLLQTFLTGGLLGVFRAPQGGWTIRGLLHGSGFYFGRFLRLALLALLAAGLVFGLNGPLARWVDGQARETVSERAALAWSLGRYGLLLLALLFVHMVSSYAKVAMVVEERSSALLAFLSSISFCLRNLGRAAGQYVTVGVLGGLLILVWNAVDSRWETVGYRTQLVTLALGQVFVLFRIGLRLSLLASQVALYRRFSSGS